MLQADDYRPPRWLRHAHLQSVLASGRLRRRLGERQMAALAPRTREYLIDGGDGVRLLGLHSRLDHRPARGLALLLHGWEGSVDSNYMRLSAASLLRAGFDVFRLNFRDHGGTHHLNPALFHSNRIDELVHASCDIAARFPQRPLVAAGYSLGGNFALRLALRAPAAGLPLAHVAAVCPVLDPARTMDALEAGLPLYRWHFERRWRHSLLRKRHLFPHHFDVDDRTLRLQLRALTAWLVERHTDYGSLEHYFDGYSIAGDRLAGLCVPASILMAADDPVIPLDDFHRLRLPEQARLDITPWGGHCGFLEGAHLHGFAERWVTERLTGTAETAGSEEEVAAVGTLGAA